MHVLWDFSYLNFLELGRVFFLLFILFWVNLWESLGLILIPCHKKFWILGCEFWVRKVDIGSLSMLFVIDVYFGSNSCDLL